MKGDLCHAYRKCGVAIYVRVSTNKQDLDNQVIQLKQWIDVRCPDMLSEVELIVYSDIASGGSTSRPGFHRMLEDARKGVFDTLYIWSLDRFSREGISSTLGYIERLRRYGVDIVSYTESWMDTTDEGICSLIIGVMSWVAKQERQRISERTKAGLSRAVNVGKRGRDKKKRRRRSDIGKKRK